MDFNPRANWDGFPKSSHILLAKQLVPILTIEVKRLHLDHVASFSNVTMV